MFDERAAHALPIENRGFQVNGNLTWNSKYDKAVLRALSITCLTYGLSTIGWAGI